MNKCKRLMHYSIFIARIRQNISNGMSTAQAIDEAISYCVKQDMLTDVLLKNRSEVCHMLLTEFDEKEFAKTMWDDGFSEGHESGFSECKTNILAIMDEINKGNDTVEKLTELGYDVDLVREVLAKK